MVITIYKIYKIDIIGSPRLRDGLGVLIHKYPISNTDDYERKL